MVLINKLRNAVGFHLVSNLFLQIEQKIKISWRLCWFKN